MGGRQRKEELLRVERERLKGIIDSVAEGVSVVGQDYKIHFQNERLTDRFGNLTGKICYKELMGFDQPCPSCPMANVIQNNRTERAELTSANGRVYLVTFTPFRDIDGELKVVESARDITERKRAEEALQQEKAHTESVINSVPDMLITIDEKGNISYANDAMAEFAGVELKEAVGKPLAQVIGELNLLTPESASIITERVKKRLQTGEPITDVEMEMRNCRGEIVPCTYSASGIRGPHGEVVGEVVLIRDITERKRMEDSIRRSNAELAALNDIAIAVSQSLDLNEILNDTLDKTLEVQEIEVGGILLINEEAGELEFAAYRGMSEEFVKGTKGAKVGEGLSGRVAQSGEPIILEDVSADPRLTKMVVKEEGLRSFAAIPLKSKGKVLGVLNLATHGQRQFTAQDIDFLTPIGDEIGVAIENATLYDSILRDRNQSEAILSYPCVQFLCEGFP